MKILSKAIYGFNAILTKITIFFFSEIEKPRWENRKKPIFPNM